MNTLRLNMQLAARFLFASLGLQLALDCAVAQPGSVDSTFAPHLQVDNYVNSIALQSDGKVIVGGEFTNIRGLARNRIARLNPDGTGDADFDPGSGATVSVKSVLLQPDGKILLGGGLTSINGSPCNYLARLNASGSLDSSFSLAAGVNYWVLALALQPNGKILVGGAFTSASNTNRSGIARLNSDGTLDESFDPGTGADYYIYSLAIQSDGKVLAGGPFTSFNGTNCYGITRLNTNGCLDSTFKADLNLGSGVFAMAIQADQRIIIGGTFTNINGTSVRRIARLNSNGSLDPTFSAGTGANGPVSCLAIQPDGKVLLGGNFTSINNQTRTRVARLNANGNLDADFDVGIGPDARVESLVVLPDGRVLLAGDFFSYNGVPWAYISRVYGDRPPLEILRMATEVRLAWPIGWNGFALQASDTLAAGWTSPGGSLGSNNGKFVVSFPATNSVQFFRLQK